MTEKRPTSGNDVLTSLPARRPQRRSAKRAPRPGEAPADATEQPATKRSSKPAPARSRRTPAKPAGKRGDAAAALNAATKPAGAAKRSAAKPKPKPAATGSIPIDETPRAPKLKAVRPSDATKRAAPHGARKPPSPDRPAGAPDGVELLGTAIQAGVELTQIGLKLGTAALRRAASRLPRP
jgi:hypothetical protein